MDKNKLIYRMINNKDKLKDLKIPVTDEIAQEYGLCPVCTNTYERPIRLNVVSIQHFPDTHEHFIFYRCPMCHKIYYAESITEEEYDTFKKNALNKENT